MKIILGFDDMRHALGIVITKENGERTGFRLELPEELVTILNEKKHENFEIENNLF